MPKRQYSDQYANFGCIELKNCGKSVPQFMVCMKTLSDAPMKPSFLQRHLLTHHPDKKDRDHNYWSSHSFPSIWKTSSIIPIYKMGKPFDPHASFRPIFLTSCVSNLFERIILSRLLFFTESNSIFSPRQAGFRPGRSTLDQILFLSQSISDGFNKPRPGSRTILFTIDFSSF